MDRLLLADLSALIPEDSAVFFEAKFGRLFQFVLNSGNDHKLCPLLLLVSARFRGRSE